MLLFLLTCLLSGTRDADAVVCRVMCLYLCNTSTQSENTLWFGSLLPPFSIFLLSLSLPLHLSAHLLILHPLCAPLSVSVTVTVTAAVIEFLMKQQSPQRERVRFLSAGCYLCLCCIKYSTLLHLLSLQCVVGECECVCAAIRCAAVSDHDINQCNERVCVCIQRAEDWGECVNEGREREFNQRWTKQPSVILRRSYETRKTTRCRDRKEGKTNESLSLFQTSSSTI